MVNLMGYCKECGGLVYDCDEIAEHEGIYECPICCHPHALDELWPEVPSYITEEMMIEWGSLSRAETEEF